MRSSWIKVAPKSNMTGVLTRRESLDTKPRTQGQGECHVMMQAEAGVCYHKPSSAWSTSKQTVLGVDSSLEVQNDKVQHAAACGGLSRQEELDFLWRREDEGMTEGEKMKE